VVAAGSALGTGTAYLWSVVLLNGAVLEYLDVSRLAARRRLSESGMQGDAFSLGETLVWQDGFGGLLRRLLRLVGQAIHVAGRGLSWLVGLSVVVYARAHHGGAVNTSH